MDLGCIVAAGHAQEGFEDVRLDAAVRRQLWAVKSGTPSAAAARLFV